MVLYFTSDTHFGHENVIEYSDRPFGSAKEMDAELIRRWNQSVRPQDEVWHLGDFAFAKPSRICELLEALNGRKHFVFGNHDQTLRKVLAKHPGFAESTHELTRVKPQLGLDTQRIVLCHYALRVWDRSHHGAWHIYGHSHGSLPESPNSLSCDIGVDCWKFTPVSLQQLAAKMATKTWRPVDHHTQETR